MRNPTPYNYAVLRYVHDVTTGEFVNVGVALYAPEARFASAICRNTYGRINRVFPGMNADHFKSLMRHIQARFEELGQQFGEELRMEHFESLSALMHHILPVDDSSLQWSPIGAGLTRDPPANLEKLFERMVMRYEETSPPARRTEDNVWRQFKRNLEQRHLLQLFEPRKVSVKDDAIEFQYTWKNGILHCLEPVSFDLKTPESIRDKAHRWLGKVTSIADTPEQFRIYFLIGPPQDAAMNSAFKSALGILQKVPRDKMICLEQDADELSERLAKEAIHYRLSETAAAEK